MSGKKIAFGAVLMVLFSFAGASAVLGDQKTPVCPVISHTLTLGWTGKEVTQLQEFLAVTGYFTYPQITSYFGSVTQSAVQAFQRAEKVVATGTPAATGYGLVGPKTRAAIARVCTAPSAQPISTQATTTTSASTTTTADSVVATVATTTSASKKPDAPSNLKRSVGFLRVELSWTSVLGALSYIVQRRTDNSEFATVATALLPSYVDTNVVTDKSYYYRVRAQNTAGVSDPSDSVEAYLRNPNHGSNTPSLIAPTIGTFANMSVSPATGIATYTITNPSSNSLGAFTYTSSDASVATVSGNVITGHGVGGTATITATQAASGIYSSGTKTATITFSVTDDCATLAPCNGGTCTRSASVAGGVYDSYTCSACPTGYSGPTCSNTENNCVDPGSGLKCAGHGSCIADPSGGYCTCNACYTGSYCQLDDLACA